MLYLTTDIIHVEVNSHLYFHQQMKKVLYYKQFNILKFTQKISAVKYCVIQHYSN